MGGGANTLSLAAHQQQALQAHPLGVATVANFSRSPDWRPLHPSEYAFENTPADGLSYFEAAGQDAQQYYWLRNPAL